MILGFKQQFPWGEPTYFREKILAGAGYGPIVSMPKIHTIRSGFRWRPGMSIQMAYGVRTKHYQQFNKDVPQLQVCTEVQKIDMKWHGPKNNDLLHGIKLPNKYLTVTIDSKEILNVTCSGSYFGCTDLYNLVKNDGFDSLTEFVLWFNSDFSGQLIHWTDYRY